MHVVVAIAGVILCLQGFSPVVQEAFGQDSTESAFLVNQVPELMPWAGLVLGAVGIALLWLSCLMRQHGRDRVLSGGGHD